MEKYAIIINRIGIVLFLINFIVCIVTIKRIKQSKKSLIISMILVIVQFYGFMEGNFLLEDTAIPNNIEMRIYAGNIIMTIAFIAQIIRIKPSTVKGDYIKNISISSTMGPGIKVENNFDK